MNEELEHDSRDREPSADQYFIAAVGGCGRVVCTVPGLTLIDFYRSVNILAPATKEKDKGEHT